MSIPLLASRVRRADWLRSRRAAGEANLFPDDAALCALTDFRLEPPLTVTAARSGAAALEDMQRLGVSALLVTPEESGEPWQRIAGLLTRRDIARRRRAGSSHDAAVAAHEPRVADLMTPWDELSLVNYESLAQLTALELYEGFQGTGLTHLLVVECDDGEAAMARGLIARARLARRLRFEAHAGWR